MRYPRCGGFGDDGAGQLHGYLTEKPPIKDERPAAGPDISDEEEANMLVDRLTAAFAAMLAERAKALTAPAS